MVFGRNLMIVSRNYKMRFVNANIPFRGIFCHTTATRCRLALQNNVAAIPLIDGRTKDRAQTFVLLEIYYSPGFRRHNNFLSNRKKHIKIFPGKLNQGDCFSAGKCIRGSTHRKSRKDVSTCKPSL
jgi:hypothetical protein